jgi:hypothetical protein
MTITCGRRRTSVWGRATAALVLLATLSGTWVPAARSAPAATASAPTAALAPSTSGFHPIAPVRVVDTRTSLGGASLHALDTRTVTLAGIGTIPASGVMAVAINVTAVHPSAAGYFTVWPAGSPRPPTSNLDFAADETRANGIVTAVDVTGKISIFNAFGTVDLIVDVTGWFSSDFIGVAPTRVLDTRTTTILAAGETRSVPIAGHAGVPGSGVAAVAVTVTVTDATGQGFVSVWPDGTAWPGASAANFDRGSTIAATALVGLGAGGGISITAGGSATDVIIDVMGYFDAEFTPATSRLFDTRDGTGTCGLFFASGETRTISIAGRGTVPGGSTGAVALNATVTQPDARGYITIWPADAAQPATSSINFVAGQTVSNSVLVGLGTAGQVSIHNGGGPTEVIIDATGYFPGVTPAGDPAPCPPLRTTTEVPVPGRHLPDGRITTDAFNAQVASLGADSAVARSPLQLAIAIAGGADNRHTTITSTAQGESNVPYIVVIDAAGNLDDSVSGIHTQVELTPKVDGTFRVASATWGYICYRGRTSPPYTTELCV